VHHALERICSRDLERHRHARKLLRMWTALFSWEYREVDPLSQVLVGRHDDSAARAAERLVGRARDDVGESERVRVRTCRRHASSVADVGKENRTHLARDLGEQLPVRRPGVGGETGYDHLGPVRASQVPDFVVIQSARRLVHPVAGDLEPLAREIKLAAVGEVAALKQVHAHDGVARFADRIVYGKVGGCAGEGLHIDINIPVAHTFVCEDERCPALCKRLHEVDIIDTLVESPVRIAAIVGELVWIVEEQILIIARHAQWWIALSVDVVEDGTKRLAHRQGGEGLRGDHDELARLALLLEVDDGIDVRVDNAEVGAKIRFPILTVGHERVAPLRRIC